MKKLLMLVLVAVIVTGLSFAGSITVNSPHGGEVWVKGAVQMITWSGSGLTNPVKITLWKNGVLVGLIVKDQPAANGTYSWTVGAYTGGTAACATDYKIKIREQGGPSFTTEDSSNANFKIDGCRGTNRFRTSAFNVPSNPKAKPKPNRPDLKVSRFHPSSRTEIRKMNTGATTALEIFPVVIKNDGNRKAIFPRGSTVFVVDTGGIQFKYKIDINFTILPGREQQFNTLLDQDLKRRQRAGTYPMTIKVDPNNIIRESNENNNSKVGQFLLKKPDLVINNVSVYNYGNGRRLLIQVKNKGNLFANFNNTTILHVTSRWPSAIKYKKPILPGKTYLFESEKLPVNKGISLDFSIVVDPKNNISESDETNNSKSFKYTTK